MKTPSKMLPPKITPKSSEKCIHFGVILRLIFELTFLFFRCAFSQKHAFGVGHPSKTRTSSFYLNCSICMNKNVEIELSPARQAQKTIFDFSNSYSFCMHEKMKIELSPTREHHFHYFARVQKNEEKKWRFLRI